MALALALPLKSSTVDIAEGRNEQPRHEAGTVDKELDRELQLGIVGYRGDEYIATKMHHRRCDVRRTHDHDQALVLDFYREPAIGWIPISAGIAIELALISGWAHIGVSQAFELSGGHRRDTRMLHVLRHARGKRVG